MMSIKEIGKRFQHNFLPRTLHHVSRVHLESFALISLSIFSPWWTLDRTFPWQTIWGERISWANRYDVLKLIEQEQSALYELYVDDDSVAEFSPSDIGIYYDAEKLFTMLFDDSVPVSKVTKSLEAIESVPVYLHPEQLEAFIATIQTEHEVKPKNATLEFVQNVAVITKEKIGKKIDASGLRSEILKAVSKAEKKIYVESTVDEPEFSGAELQKVADLYDSIDTRESIEIIVGDKTFQLDSNTMTALVDTNLLKSEARLALSYGLVQSYVAGTIAPLVATVGVPEQITLTDGVVSGTTQGVRGSILDESDLTEKIMTAFSKNTQKVRGNTVAAAIETVTEKRYSRSAVGLDLLLKDWDSGHAGEWGVSILDGTDSSIRAELHPDEPFVTASIYKLFVASYMYSKIDSGDVDIESQTALGKSYGKCLEDMIVVSDNACPTYFFNNFGYSAIQSYVASNGYSATDVDNSRGGDKYTTAKDTMALMQDLASGKLISSESLQLLREDMSRQIYRSGIPKGVGSTYVEDKVGFLYGNNHDAAFIGGNRPYTLVILSDGASFQAISELTQAIHATMTR